MSVIKKKSPICELRSKDTKIQQIFKYIGFVLSEAGKYDNGIGRGTGVEKYVFQKLSKLLVKRKKKRVMKCLCNITLFICTTS